MSHLEEKLDALVSVSSEEARPAVFSSSLALASPTEEGLVNEKTICIRLSTAAKTNSDDFGRMGSYLIVGRIQRR